MTQSQDRIDFFDFVCHMTMNDKGCFNFSWDPKLGRIAFIEGKWQPVGVLNELYNQSKNKTMNTYIGQVLNVGREREKISDIVSFYKPVKELTIEDLNSIAPVLMESENLCCEPGYPIAHTAVCILHERCKKNNLPLL